MTLDVALADHGLSQCIVSKAYSIRLCWLEPCWLRLYSPEFVSTASNVEFEATNAAKVDLKGRPCGHRDSMHSKPAGLLTFLLISLLHYKCPNAILPPGFPIVPGAAM